jgi:hypothetical protein
MQSEDKITGTMRFIEEQLRSLKRNSFNGTFSVRFGIKDGGICTTGTSVDQFERKGVPEAIFTSLREENIKND